jgi:hypothetical protein
LAYKEGDLFSFLYFSLSISYLPQVATQPSFIFSQIWNQSEKTID